MKKTVLFADASAFRSWLQLYASTSSELFVQYHKVSTGHPNMSWSESVDEALCFGWIDGRRNRISETAYSIRFTPRKKSSIWSAINIAKVERLRLEGRMTAAGEQAFALRTGLKSGVYFHEQAAPTELSVAELDAFKADPVAWMYFEASPPGYRKRVQHWVTSAKREDTRSSRLLSLINASSVNQRLP